MLPRRYVHAIPRYSPAQIKVRLHMCLLTRRGGGVGRGGWRYDNILPKSCRSSPHLLFHSLSESITVLPRLPSYSTLTNNPLQVVNTALVRSSLRKPLIFAPAKLAPSQQQRGHSHGHGHHHHHDNTYLTSKNKTDAGVRITRLGLYTNAGMAISKGIGGWYFNSQALVRGPR